MKGLFIVMEGPDGSGKTTQINLLKEYLEEAGYECLITREPGGTVIGEEVRQLILNPEHKEMSPVTEMLLYAASRAQLVHEVIGPALEEGKIVISDRFVDSSIVYQGIAGGIEKFCKVAIPALFIILVGLAIYAVTLNGANQGLQYLFTVKKEYILSPNTWIQAFIQAAWSTGAGWGFIITYANYVGEEEDVPTSCLIMGLGDNLGAILSALVVIPAICALSATPEAANEALSQGNFGLTFIYIYQLFTTIPGGRFISFIFFGLLAIAAITSLFSMIEVGVKCVVDLGLPRKKAVVSVCFAGFLVGCFSCWSLVNIDNQDWVWGIGLLVSGAFIAILAWKYGVEKLRTQEVNAKGADVHLPKAYYTGCMYLIPVLVVIMVVYWLLQTKEWFPNTWLNPFIIQDNTGTVLLQFGVVILAGLALSRFFNTKTAKGAMKDNEAGK